MKRILAAALCLMMVLVAGLALAETAVDTTEIITQVVIWVLCGVLTALGALATWAAKKYLIPWLKTTVVPWLRQNNLLDAAKVAVEYAEAVVGRNNGDEKWKLALTLLESKGWNINSTEVITALKAKWQELDLAQVAAGVKSAVTDTGEANAITAGMETAEDVADTPVDGVNE